jgi:hypothetical protein
MADQLNYFEFARQFDSRTRYDNLAHYICNQITPNNNTIILNKIDSDAKTFFNKSDALHNQLILLRHMSIEFSKSKIVKVIDKILDEKTDIVMKYINKIKGKKWGECILDEGAVEYYDGIQNSLTNWSADCYSTAEFLIYIFSAIEVNVRNSFNIVTLYHEIADQEDTSDRGSGHTLTIIKLDKNNAVVIHAYGWIHHMKAVYINNFAEICDKIHTNSLTTDDIINWYDPKSEEFKNILKFLGINKLKLCKKRNKATYYYTEFNVDNIIYKIEQLKN